MVRSALGKTGTLSNANYGMLLSIPGLILLLAWVLLPLFIVIGLSFYRYDNVSPVRFIGLLNYQEVFSNPDFPKILLRTFEFSFGSTALSLFTSVVVAACLNRIGSGSAVFRSLVVMPWAVPLILSGFLWAWMFHPSFGPISDLLLRSGLRDTALNIYEDPISSMVGVIIADAWRRIPFLAIITLAAFQAIDQELYDAARVDGADSIDTFMYITLPLGSRPILIGTLITLMFTFRSIDVIYSMTPGGGYAKSTYVMGAYLFDNLYEFLNFGAAAAISVILILLTFVIGSLFIYYTLKRQ
ncbi:MAG TPA: sugar ABC transporter permease [Caldilineae bacterium]|nr:sugar ABC transporter permease [Caldilineae bacterium]